MTWLVWHQFLTDFGVVFEALCGVFIGKELYDACFGVVCDFQNFECCVVRFVDVEVWMVVVGVVYECAAVGVTASW